MMPMFGRYRGWMIGLGLLFTVPVLHAADSPAAMVSADVGFYAEIQGITELRQRDHLTHIWRVMGRRFPGQQNPELLGQIQEMLGLTRAELIDRYFGRSVALVAQEAREGAAGFLISRVDAADRDLAVEKLQLKMTLRAGVFTFYTSGDGNGLLGFSDRWMILGDIKHLTYAQRQLRQAAKGPTLAAHPLFQSWTARLPEERQATVYFKRPVLDYPHVISFAVDEANVLRVRYAGLSPEVTRRIEGRLVKSDAQAVLPLPTGTLMSASVHLHESDPGPGRIERVDRLFAPAKYAKDIAPKIDGPMTLVYGKLEADSVEPNPGGPIPFGAMAWRIKDPSVVPDLERTADRLMVLLNLGLVRWKTGPVDFQPGEHAGHAYRVAELFTPVARAWKQPELAGLLKPAYGQVGQWYVVASQEQALRQMIDALEVPRDEAAPVARSGHTLVQVTARPAELSSVLEVWMQRLQQMFPDQDDSLGKMLPMIRALKLLDRVQMRIAQDAEKPDVYTLQLDAPLAAPPLQNRR